MCFLRGDRTRFAIRTLKECRDRKTRCIKRVQLMIWTGICNLALRKDPSSQGQHRILRAGDKMLRDPCLNPVSGQCVFTFSPLCISPQPPFHCHLFTSGVNLAGSWSFFFSSLLHFIFSLKEHRVVCFTSSLWLRHHRDDRDLYVIWWFLFTSSIYL